MSEEKRFDMGVAADMVKEKLKEMGITDGIRFEHGRKEEDGSYALYFTSRDLYPGARVFPDGKILLKGLRESIKPKLDLQALKDENLEMKLQIENLMLRKKLDELQNKALAISDSPYRKYGEKYTTEIVIERETTPRIHLVTAYFSGDEDDVRTVIDRFLTPYNEAAPAYNIMSREGI